ncbi:MAG: peptidase M10A and M12B matrixin and adamalysin, partial [Nitrosopumilales archaeon CG11_big_fil_rev_8_21_14_0_20_33_24]
ISEDKKDQSVKSTITIYNVEELSTSQITTIVRHEFGHAIGLAHTTATE